jgi:ketosteroid isomerase-like protein
VQTDATRALVRDVYGAYASGDRDRLAALIDEDIDWIMSGPVQLFSFFGARRGKAAVLATLAGIAQDYELQRYEPEVIIVEGDRAVVNSNVAFVQRSTGRLIRFRPVALLRFRANRLVEFREVADTFDMAEQALGRWLVK